MTNIDIVSVTPTVTATPDYDSGDAVGGLLTVSLGGSSGPRILNYVSISSKSDLGVAASLILFKANPAASTFTDN